MEWDEEMDRAIETVKFKIFNFNSEWSVIVTKLETYGQKITMLEYEIDMS